MVRADSDCSCSCFALVRLGDSSSGCAWQEPLLLGRSMLRWWCRFRWCQWSRSHFDCRPDKNYCDSGHSDLTFTCCLEMLADLGSEVHRIFFGCQSARKSPDSNAENTASAVLNRRKNTQSYHAWPGTSASSTVERSCRTEG